MIDQHGCEFPSDEKVGIVLVSWQGGKFGGLKKPADGGGAVADGEYAGEVGRGIDALEPYIHNHGQELKEIVYPWMTLQGVARWELLGGATLAPRYCSPHAERTGVRPTDPVWFL